MSAAPPPPPPSDAELAALRAFRDAIDAASVAYHGGTPEPFVNLVGLRALERTIRVSLAACQDALGGAPAREEALGRFVAAALAYGAAHAAEMAARETWLGAVQTYSARNPSPPRRKGWAAYEHWQDVMRRAVKPVHDAYDAAREATKAAQDALHAAYAARAGGDGAGDEEG